MSKIRWKIEALNDGRELYYRKKYVKIEINTDDYLALNKPLKFPKMTTITRWILQDGEKLYPQTYLDEYLNELL